MTVYVALLRAINVGGKNKVPMSDLRLVFESLGLTDVKTMLNPATSSLLRMKQRCLWIK